METVIDKIQEAEESASRAVSKAKESAVKQLTLSKKENVDYLHKIKGQLAETKKNKLEEFDKKIGEEAEQVTKRALAEVSVIEQKFTTKKSELLSVVRKQLNLE